MSKVASTLMSALLLLVPPEARGERSHPEYDREAEPSKEASEGEGSDEVELMWGAPSEGSPERRSSPRRERRERSAGLGLSKREADFGPRRARFRMQPPMMQLMGTGELGVGIEYALGIEFRGGHVFLLDSSVSFGPRSFFHAGAGYAYSIELASKAVLFEPGLMVGYAGWDEVDEPGVFGGESIRDFGTLGFKGTFHFGYEYFFFSVGARMYAAPGIAGGMVAGFNLRI